MPKEGKQQPSKKGKKVTSSLLRRARRLVAAFYKG